MKETFTMCGKEVTAYGGCLDIEDGDLEGGCIMFSNAALPGRYVFVHFPSRWDPQYQVGFGMEPAHFKTNNFGIALDEAFRGLS